MREESPTEAVRRGCSAHLRPPAPQARKPGTRAARRRPHKLQWATAFPASAAAGIASSAGGDPPPPPGGCLALRDAAEISPSGNREDPPPPPRLRRRLRAAVVRRREHGAHPKRRACSRPASADLRPISANLGRSPRSKRPPPAPREEAAAAAAVVAAAPAPSVNGNPMVYSSTASGEGLACAQMQGARRQRR